MLRVSFTHPCSGRAVTAINNSARELTLTEALADPLVRTVMAADGVDPHELAAVMSRMARVIDRHLAR